MRFMLAGDTKSDDLIDDLVVRGVALGLGPPEAGPGKGRPSRPRRPPAHCPTRSPSEKKTPRELVPEMLFGLSCLTIARRPAGPKIWARSAPRALLRPLL